MSNKTSYIEVCIEYRYLSTTIVVLSSAYKNEKQSVCYPCILDDF